MQIGEMFVRMTADVSDLKGRMTEAERALGRTGAAAEKMGTQVERGTGTAKLGVGRLGNQFGSLIASMTGVPPIATNVLGVLGNFAIGAGVMTGILAGVAALSLAYRKMTESGRDSQKAADDLTKSLLAQADAAKLATIAGREAIAGQAFANEWLAERALEGVGRRGIIDPFGFEGRERAAAQRRLDDARRARGQADWNVIDLADELAGRGQHAKKGPKAKDPFWETFDAPNIDLDAVFRGSGGLDAIIDAKTEKVMQDFFARMAATAPSAGEMGTSGTGTYGPSGKLLKDIAGKTDGIGNKIVGALKDNAAYLISGLGGLLSALLVGGGGRGSQIGGSIGGAILGTIGIGGGPIGAAIGGVVGTLAGSLFGGLFDKKKKVASGLDMMATQLARVNQQLRNAPSGYRTAGEAYAATHIPIPGAPGGPTVPGGGGGPGGPGSPDAPGPGGPGGGVPPITVNSLTVYANSPAQLVRELQRAVSSFGSRGGPVLLGAG